MGYILFLQNLREATAGVFDKFMLQVTAFGEPLITFLLLAFIYWCVDKRTGQLMAFNVSFACWLNQWIKKIFKVERPWVRDKRIVPLEEAIKGAGGYSMPSGHTTRAFATWGAAGASAWKKVKWISVFSWSIVAIVMFSRNYLGVHTFADVAFAFVFGIVILLLSDFILKWVDKKADSVRDIIVCISGCIIIFLPMLKFGCLSNAGAAFGFLIGWVLERRLISFKITESFEQKIIRFLPGAVVVFVCFTSGTNIVAHIVPSKYAGFFLQGFVSFFVMFFYPLIFHIWENETLDKVAKRKLKTGMCLLLISFLTLLTVVGVYRTVHNYKNMGLSVGTSVDKEVNLLNPNTKINGSMKVIGHRGYSSIAPENTLSSFKYAVDVHADMVELDVQMTKDGKVIVFHDTDMARITGNVGNVSDYTMEEIGLMDAGSWFSDRFKGERIPTLEEVLDLLKNGETGIYLELKNIGNVPGFAETVVEEVVNHEMQDRVVFASFCYEYLETIKELDSTFLILCNTDLGDADRLLADYPADIYGLYIENLLPDTVSKLKEAGSTAYIYTVNSPKEMRYVMALDADGMVTNYPGTAKALLSGYYALKRLG